MTSATHKRVALRLLPRRLLTGILDPTRLRPAPPGSPVSLDLLLPDGQSLSVNRAELQAAFFLADFSHASELDASIPRGAVRLPGVRVRCRTRDRLTLDGLLASDLLALNSGLDLSPPYVGCPWQHVYVPAHGVEHLEIIEVIHPPRRRQRPPTPPSQHSLFEFPTGE